MTAADYEAVAEVGFAAWKSSGKDEAGFDEPKVVEAARTAFHDYPATAKGDVAVAELDGRVIGWAAREDEPDHISDIWVDPAFQGHGAGSALLRHLLDRISADGFRSAKIHTRATNLRAIGFYERSGFSIVWRGPEQDSSLGISLEKVHLEKELLADSEQGGGFMTKSNLAQMVEAFDRLSGGGFKMDADWQTVHQICQDHEGEQFFDWGHALCHRIEGDDWNADYWYRRAGKTRTGSIAEEWSVMRAELSGHL
jgi:ribosomal-protein-alanine N-acetyltransferase